MRLVRVMDWLVRLKMAALLVIASLLPLGIMAFEDIRTTGVRCMQ
jgi:hypothetical protein